MREQNPRKFDFYFETNSPKAVLLIHGITGTPSEMRYLGKNLFKAGFSVLCNSLPRHCASLGELRKVTWQEIYAACLSDLEALAQEHSQVFVGGISMGALMAIHLASEFPDRVSGIIALAPTVFYDGWALHKGKILMNLFWHIPAIRNRINIRESHPYGLKDENTRSNIERFYRQAKSSEYDDKVLLFGSPFFPLANLYQHHLFTKVVKKEISRVHTPILIIHAQEDDMASPRNARYIFQNISSSQKDLIMLHDSYHMITIDKEKDRVAQEVVKFLERTPD